MILLKSIPLGKVENSVGKPRKTRERKLKEKPILKIYFEALDNQGGGYLR